MCGALLLSGWIVEPALADTTLDALANQVRIEHGLPTVPTSSLLTDLAARRATEASVVFDHRDISPDLAGVCWTWWGENLYARTTWDYTHEHAMEAWVNSPHHLDNLLYPTWDILGSATFAADDGMTYAVQVFVDLCDPAPSTAPAPPVESEPGHVYTTPALLPDTAMDREGECLERLDIIRQFLLMGTALTGWLAWSLFSDKPKPKAETKKSPDGGYCPLHRCDPADCEDKH